MSRPHEGDRMDACDYCLKSTNQCGPCTGEVPREELVSRLEQSGRQREADEVRALPEAP